MRSRTWMNWLAMSSTGTAFAFLGAPSGCWDALELIQTIDNPSHLFDDSCRDGIDNDGDGFADWLDPDCPTLWL